MTIRILIFALFCFSTSVAQPQRYTYEKGLMGSPFKLIFYADSDSLAYVAAQKAFERIEKLNESLSDYRDGSEINNLSAQSGSGKWVHVSKELFEILAVSQDISVKTNGAFDATVGPVVQLWRRSVRKEIFPEKAEIDAAMQKVGYEKLEMNKSEQTVLLKVKGMRLDVGGLGKGFAAEEAGKILKGFGIKSAMIDAGGKIVVYDAPPGTTGWKINVSNGRDSLRTFELSNSSVATSGPTYRYLEKNGVRYSHIVDPKTGIGLLHHVRTTVIVPDGTISDALATAFSVAGIEESKKYMKYFPDAKVWLVEVSKEQVRQWDTLE